MSRDLIFISFRNGDGDVLADHIDGELRRQFGDDNVFRSGRSIPPGMAFDKVLYDALNRACVLLVIIGPRWAGVTDSGGRRIDVPGDWVRTEVALSLAAGIRVIPILLNNTPLPTAEQLPDDLKELSKRQTIPYRTKFGHRDCAHLVDELREIYEITRVQPQSGPVQLPSGTSRRLNFQVLDDLLASRRWEEADRETASLLWAAAGGDPNTSRAHLIEPDQVDGLARDDVRSIDLLWRHRSDGRFGFTPQRDALRQAMRRPDRLRLRSRLADESLDLLCRSAVLTRGTPRTSPDPRPNRRHSTSVEIASDPRRIRLDGPTADRFGALSA